MQPESTEDDLDDTDFFATLNLEEIELDCVVLFYIVIVRASFTHMLFSLLLCVLYNNLPSKFLY
jgi:hypothetical protein